MAAEAAVSAVCGTSFEPGADVGSWADMYDLVAPDTSRDVDGDVRPANPFLAALKCEGVCSHTRFRFGRSAERAGREAAASDASALELINTARCMTCVGDLHHATLHEQRHMHAAV